MLVVEGRTYSGSGAGASSHAMAVVYVVFKLDCGNRYFLRQVDRQPSIA